MKDLQKPCAACPFSRSVAPGALGGSPVEMYLGQSVGPFMLPCHKTCDLDNPDWKQTMEHDTKQCAGAAIYRTNVGVAGLMPEGIHRLPGDTKTVFASHAEFMAHHLQISVDLAQRLLVLRPIHLMLRYELSKAAVRRIEL